MTRRAIVAAPGSAVSKTRPSQPQTAKPRRCATEPSHGLRTPCGVRKSRAPGQPSAASTASSQAETGSDRAWPRECEQAMVVAVAGDLVAVRGELSNQVLVRPRGTAEDEERPVVTTLREESADRGRGVDRTVVEGQGKCVIVRPDRRSSNRPEQRQVLKIGAGQVGRGQGHGAARDDLLAAVTPIEQIADTGQPQTDSGAGSHGLPLIHDQAATRSA